MTRIAGLIESSPVTAQVTADLRAGRLLVAFSGEVDLGLTDRVDQICARVSDVGSPVDVDLTDVTFFCAQGVGFITRLRAAAPDGDVRLVGASPIAAMVLDWCHIPWQRSLS